MEQVSSSGVRAFVIGLLTVLGIAGCYDSRWGERERTQRHNAEHLAPATLEGAPSSALAKHTFRVRIYATPRYTGQTLDWQKDMRAIVDAANQLLEPGLGAHLAIDAMTSWDPQLSSDDLGASLEAVAQNDAGKDVDWVIGLVGGLPKYTLSFHDLGRGVVLGKHIVLRAGTDLLEHDAIDKAFDELSPSERLELVHDRRRHRAVAVLLHEIGHTLGAIHETTAGGLMLPTYDAKMSGFGPAALEVVRASIERRDDPPGNDTLLALAHDLLGCYRGQNAPLWSDAERVAMIAELEGLVAKLSPKTAPTTTTTTTATTNGAGPKPPAEVAPHLKEKDRTAYAAAYDKWKSGDFAGARATALPLFSTYPEVYAVQDFRCQLAMAQKLAWEATKAECAQLMKLSTKK